MIICEVEGDKAFYLPNRYSDLDLELGDDSVTVLAITESEVVVRAERFTPYAMIDVPYVLAENCFMMKKGEIRRIKILGR